MTTNDSEPGARHTRVSSTAPRLIWMSETASLALLLLLTAAFFLCWFNRFAGIRSGTGEFAGGVAILAGKIPYRDYFNPGPPLNALKAALLMKLFGHSLFVLHAAAVVERLLLAGLLYRWLLRLFPRTSAWVASLVTILLSAGDRTDPLASYNHDAVLFGIAAAMCLDAIECRRQAARPERSVVPLLFSAGVFTSLSALTKQTVGAGCFVFFLCWIVLTSWRAKHTLRDVLIYAAGVLTAAVPIAVWLWRNHALRAWVRMNLREGPAAKGGNALDFVRRMLLVAYDNAGWIALAVFLVALSAASLLRPCKPTVDLEKANKESSIWTTFAIFGSVLAAAIVAGQTSLPTLHDQGKSAVYYVLFVLPLIAWLILIRWRDIPAQRIATQRLLLFTGTGLTIALTLSLSWPAFEAMLLPGLALPVAMVLTCCTPFARRCVIVLLTCAVFLQTREKLDLPFGFDYQDEAPVREAHTRSSQAMLRGEVLPESTVRFLDDTVRLIASCVRPGETVFTYPEMSLIYSLSGTAPPTLSQSHNIDVVNDAFAVREAETLKAHPPRVLVYYPESEQQQRDAERLWRNRRPAGQRAIVQAIGLLLPRYSLVQTYRLRPDAPVIGVYLRRQSNSYLPSCR